MAVSSGKAWRELREKGIEVELPSGNVVRLRPVNIEKLFKLGRVPDSLTNMVAEIIGTGQATNENVVQMATKYLELKDLIVEAAMLEPKVVSTPVADDEISIDDVSPLDSQFIFAWAQRPQKELSTFRNEQDVLMESAHDGKDVLMQAE